MGLTFHLYSCQKSNYIEEIILSTTTQLKLAYT